MKWRWSGLIGLVAACGLIDLAYGQQQQPQSTGSSPGISNEANAAIQQCQSSGDSSVALRYQTSASGS